MCTAPGCARESERSSSAVALIGILIACVARSAGADVLVLEVSDTRRAFAETLALRAVDPAAGDVQALIADWTDDAGADVAFEDSGAVAGLATAIESLAGRGRIVVVAIHSDAAAARPLPDVFWRELTLLGARVYERRDFEQAVKLLDAGAIPAEQLITSVEPLVDVAAAFAELESGRAMKVLIDCRASG